MFSGFKKGNILHGGTVTAGDVKVLEEKLLFDRSPVRDRYVKYFVLLFLAAVISTYGVVGNSIATIIGAMIVAPMMTPIMAISLSAIAGDAKNIIISTFLVAAGTALVVFLSWGLAGILPGIIEIAGNASITSRTSPRLIDLIVALAAGAAGAFASGREDVSDALPGVAIAVSLVPPLSVVGVCLSAGEGSNAMGAFVLFLTNFLAIVAAGLIVFALMGYGGAALNRRNLKARHWAVVVVVASIVIVSVPLGATSYRVAIDQILEQKTQASAKNWLGPTDYDIIEIRADGRKVEMVIAGEGDVPEIDSFLADLGKKVGKVDVSVRVVPEQTLKGVTVGE